MPIAGIRDIFFNLTLTVRVEGAMQAHQLYSLSTGSYGYHPPVKNHDENHVSFKPNSMFLPKLPSIDSYLKFCVLPIMADWRKSWNRKCYRVSWSGCSATLSISLRQDDSSGPSLF